MEDRASAREAVREAELLVVDEEERLVATVEESRQHDRAADTAAVLIQLDLVPAAGRRAC